MYEVFSFHEGKTVYEGGFDTLTEAYAFADFVKEQDGVETSVVSTFQPKLRR